MRVDWDRVIHTFNQGGFHEAFREDLLHAQSQVLLLSPYMAIKRATYYYAHLQNAVRRGCRVAVCSKPMHEVTGDLRDDHPRIVATLERIGAAFHTRSGMHEKVAILDGGILWSGSLNILSHNSTTEVMHRIQVPEVVPEVIEELSLHTFLGQATAKLPEESVQPQPSTPGDDLRTCPECGRPMTFFADSSMWICSGAPGCSNFDLADEPTSEPLARVQQVADRGQSVNPASAQGKGCDQLPDFRCPDCGADVEVHRGLRRRVACSSEICDFELDPQLSKWLLKALRRAGA